jgi:hypothetical protein
VTPWRRTRLGLALLGLLVAAVAVALPYLDALGFVVRAADLPGAAATVAELRARRVERDAVQMVPTRYGPVASQRYRPAGTHRLTLLLIPGVHRDGIHEARLVGLADDLAATGYQVVAISTPDLQRYRITPASTDIIEDAAVWLADLTGERIGMLGVSFSGGLSIVAAGRPSLANKLAWVLSFGGHGNLARVMHYLCSGEVQGDLDKARASGYVVGAEHVAVHPPHDYGVAVVLLSLADRMVPPEQVAALSEGIDTFLLASSLDLTDKAAALRTFDEAKRFASDLPEPSRTLMTWVNDRAVDKLGPVLLPVVDALENHPAMPSLSAERAPTAPAVPVFLLHGTDDNVIPSVETVLLAEYLQGRTPVRGLLSGLITHAEVNRAAAAVEVWRLARFWHDVMVQ